MTPEDLNQARILSMSASALLPLIESMHTRAYDDLIANFRTGKGENLALIARCDAYKTLLDEINYKLQSLENLSKEK